MICVFFFFKQKTAYEMRISDWSSDVCSSDLIYGEGCGAVDHAALEVIDKNANFRSAGPIVSMLNRMRPALPQIPSDADVPGAARLFHTNAWPGQRRTGTGAGHWTGDTSAEAARAYFDHLKARLLGEGWDFSVERTKILILSHRVLDRQRPSLTS